MSIARRKSKPIRIGTVTVGGDAPIAVQSMTKTDTRDVKATVSQIKELEEHGCDIVRLAVPDREAARALAAIKAQVALPLIADVHFDPRLAIQALKSGADGLRLNPGNIGDREDIARIAREARDREVPIRVGVNAGSLPPAGSKAPVAEQMANAALAYIRMLESMDFGLIKVSLKAFDVPTTVQAYELIADRTPYPLHLGITEAGLPPKGLIRNAVGIGILLYRGIGDTIRVSLSAHPREEVVAGYEILKCLGLRERGATLVSCPSCGRTEVDILSLAKAVDKELDSIKGPLKIAIMGCVVNGPGEARDADIGIACGKGKGALFRHGKVVGTVPEQEFYKVLLREIRELSDLAKNDEA